MQNEVNHKMVSVAKAENLDLVNAVANVLGEKQIVNEDGHTDVLLQFVNVKL